MTKRIVGPVRQTPWNNSLDRTDVEVVDGLMWQAIYVRLRRPVEQPCDSCITTMEPFIRLELSR